MKSKLSITLVFILFICATSSCFSQKFINTPTSNVLMKIQADNNILFSELSLNPNKNFIAAEGVEKNCMGKCTSNVYLINIRDGTTINAINTPAIHPEWDDKGFLSYLDIRDKSTTGIYVVDNNFENPKYLNSGKYITWSNDHQFLAATYSIFNDDTSKWSNFIEISNSTSLEKRRIIEFPECEKMDNILIGKPFWSYDSTKLVFLTWEESTNNEMINNIRLYDLVENKISTINTAFKGIKNISFLPGDDWILITYGLNDQLAFINLDNSCSVTTDIDEINHISSFNDGNLLFFTDYAGEIYTLNFNILLGNDFEKLICNNVVNK